MKLLDPHKQVFTKPTIATFTGKLVNPFDLQPEDIDPRDIAHALSMQCRYTGHVREFYSVGEHCVLIHDYLEMMEYDTPVLRRALLHDGDETYFLDLAAPIKHYVNGFGEKFKEAANEVTKRLVKRFDLIDPEPPIIKEVDVQLREVEISTLFPPLPGREHKYSETFLPIRIRNWSPTEAEFQFLCRLEGHGIVKRDKNGDWQPT